MSPELKFVANIILAITLFSGVLKYFKDTGNTLFDSDSVLAVDGSALRGELAVIRGLIGSDNPVFNATLDRAEQSLSDGKLTPREFLAQVAIMAKEVNDAQAAEKITKAQALLDAGDIDAARKVLEDVPAPQSLHLND